MSEEMSREEFNSAYESMLDREFSELCIIDYTGKIPREEIMYENDYTMSSIMSDSSVVDSDMYNSISKRLCRAITTDIDIWYRMGDITEENILEAKSRLEGRLTEWLEPVEKVGEVCMLMSWDIYDELDQKGLLSKNGKEYKGIKIIVDHSRTCNNYKRVILYLSGSIIVSVSRPSELDFKSRDVRCYNNGEWVDLVKENGSVTWEVGVKQVTRELLVLK